MQTVPTARGWQVVGGRTSRAVGQHPNQAFAADRDRATRAAFAVLVARCETPDPTMGPHGLLASPRSLAFWQGCLSFVPFASRLSLTLVSARVRLSLTPLTLHLDSEDQDSTMSDAIMITLDLASALANASRTPRHDQAFKLIDSTPSPDMLMSEKAAFISSPLSLTPSSVRSRSSSPLLGAQARWQEATSSHSGQHRRRRRVAAYLLLALGLATLVLAAYWHRRPLAQALDEVLEDIYLDKQDNSPYKRMGELLVNEIEPVRRFLSYISSLGADARGQDENVWRPFEGAPTPAHMRKLRQQLGVIPSGETPVERRLLRRSHRHRRRVEDSLSWLTDATVLLVGDSIERLHAADFCDFVGGKLELITPLHVASPPTYRKPVEGTPDEIQGRRALEDSWEARGSHWHITRPYVCTVPRYNATLITTFTWVSRASKEQQSD